jgi:hypothetical protein
MKHRSLVMILLLTSLVGCDLEQPELRKDPGGERGNITADFRLRDTLGRESYVFRSGDEFILRLVLSNQTSQPQGFSFTPPAVNFEIQSGDSLVCTSVDGLVFPQVVLRDSIEARGTLTEQWRATKTTARPGGIALEPGQYTARAWIGCAFDSFGVLPPRTASFAITPPLPRPIVMERSDPSRWPVGNYTLHTAALDGDTLMLKVSCRAARDVTFNLVAWNWFMESNPVQAYALLSFQPDTTITENVFHTAFFDLTPLKEAYWHTYGFGAGTIILGIRYLEPARARLWYRFS